MLDNIHYYTAKARISQFPAPARFWSPPSPLAGMFAFPQYNTIHQAARRPLSDSIAKSAARRQPQATKSNQANVSL